MKQKSGSRRHRIRLAPGRELRRGTQGNGHVLVCPAGPVQLNDSAANVLALCNGSRTREEIVGRVLAERHHSLADDVREFLDAARRHGWIVEK